MTGEIVEVGEGVSDYKLGDRVFVSHHVPCNECMYCKSDHHTACDTLHKTNYDPGGFAEYVRIPKINVESGIYPLPDDLSYIEATMIEPLACVVRGQRLAGDLKDKTVLVLGAGMSGLLHIQLAKLNGASKIIATDVSEWRLGKAKEFGADAVIAARQDVPAKAREANDGRLADLVIVATGAESAAKQALECVDRGGIILYFAVPKPGVSLPIPINDFWRNEITVKTSYGAAPQDLEESLKIIAAGKLHIKDMITHTIGLTDVGKAFKLVAEAQKSLKIIVKPQE